MFKKLSAKYCTLKKGSGGLSFEKQKFVQATGQFSSNVKKFKNLKKTSLLKENAWG